jgi:putative transposase
VRREGDKWFASIQVETGAIVEALGVPPTLGIDLNIAVFAATSDGQIVDSLNALKKQQRQLKHAQRAVSRKVKGSSNRKKAIVRLGDIHRRIAHQRAHWLHKLTTELANRHAVIAIEDLKIKNMSASARGTAAAPGSKVRQKAGLNRGILDAAWGEFTRQLTYKLEWRGGRVILVNPAYTSRTCRLCHHESAENRKTQAVFACVACGHTENADVHAAKNILAAGYAVWEGERTASVLPTDACPRQGNHLRVGGVVRRPQRASAGVAASVKQEPTEATVLA